MGTQWIIKTSCWIILEEGKMTCYDYVANKNLTDRWIDLKFSMSILENMDYNMTKTRLF